VIKLRDLATREESEIPLDEAADRIAGLL
jgi:hypothetical protein